MPTLSYFVYCESTQAVANDPRTHLVGPLQILISKYIPSNYSFGIAFGIMEIDTKYDHEIQVKFIGPQNEVCFDSGTIKVPNPPENIELPPELQGMQLTLDIRNAPIQNEGEHNTQIYLDGELIGSRSIFVIKR